MQEYKSSAQNVRKDRGQETSREPGRWADGLHSKYCVKAPLLRTLRIYPSKKPANVAAHARAALEIGNVVVGHSLSLRTRCVSWERSG